MKTMVSWGFLAQRQYEQPHVRTVIAAIPCNRVLMLCSSSHCVALYRCLNPNGIWPLLGACPIGTGLFQRAWILSHDLFST